MQGSLRNQNICVSVFNCDPTGGGDDQFLGHAVIDLYAAVPFDESDAGKRSRVYDDWISLEGGLSEDAVVRIQMFVDETANKAKPTTVEDNEDVDFGLLNEDSERSPEAFAAEVTNEDVEQPAITIEPPPEDEAGYYENSVYPEEADEHPSELSRTVFSPHEKAGVLWGTIEPGRRKPSVAADGGEIQIHQLRRPSDLSLPTTTADGGPRRISVTFAPFALKLQILEGRDLVPRDPEIAAVSGPFPNSYCFMEWHDEVLATAAIEHTLNPKWKNEKFELPVCVSDLQEKGHVRMYLFLLEGCH